MTVKRAGAGAAAIVVVLSLLTSPAAAQNGTAQLGPKSPYPLESVGQVVLTITMWRAGRVTYKTIDGTCRVDYPPTGGEPEANCWGQQARAPEDYTLTSGEMVFTTGGTKMITIPIVDDSEAEYDEAFTFAAWEEANADPFIPRGDSLTVRIDDEEDRPRDEYYSAPPARSSTNTVAASGQSSGSTVGAAGPTSAIPPGAGAAAAAVTTTTTEPRSRSLQVALPDAELRPGPGFELTSEDLPQTAPDPAGGGGPDGLSVGTIAALGVGALAVTRRRRRWSATHS